MNVVVEGRVEVDGQWWDISVEVNVPSGEASVEKGKIIKAYIRGMSSNGIISRVPSPSPQAQQPPPNQPPENETDGLQSPMFTWPAPQCKTHRVDMKESNVQEKPGATCYYCTSKIPTGYCKSRAAVDHKNAHPTFWEVK